MAIDTESNGERKSESLLRVALIEPEIPPNTGNIARLCAATFTPLHLVGKLGFRTDEKAVRRAGLDYWSEVEIHYHLNIEALYAQVPEEWTRWIFSDRVDTRLARARHGDSSGVRGAAWLWEAS